jgi:hypothetical protein
LLLPTVCQSAPAVRLSAASQKINLALNADILEDPNGKLTINEVTSSALDGQWVRNHEPTPNFALSDSAYWVRITLTSDLEQRNIWWLEVAFTVVMAFNICGLIIRI